MVQMFSSAYQNATSYVFSAPSSPDLSTMHVKIPSSATHTAHTRSNSGGGGDTKRAKPAHSRQGSASSLHPDTARNHSRQSSGSSSSSTRTHRKTASTGRSAQVAPTYAGYGKAKPIPTGGAYTSSRLAPGDRTEAHDLVDAINKEHDLYRVLGVAKRAKPDEFRRAYIGRSRICHPDKLPSYPPATSAFQKLSFAYETLSKPSSRRLYDISGRSEWDSPDPNGRASQAGFGDETLHGVLHTMFGEFMEGDFEMIRVLVNALNEGNPGLNLGEEAVENLEGAFRKIREMLLAGQKYLRIVKFEFIRLYEIQHSLRQLSYFNVLGRLRLTLQLARVTLSIPMAIDKAMKEDDDDEDTESDSDADLPAASVPVQQSSSATSSPSGPAAPGGATNEQREASAQARRERKERRRRRKAGKAVVKRGLLGPRAAGLLGMAVGVLEKGENII
ncbi:uncharacterized protein L969DRAFT_19559 [Mixia osmundae IAM 14324]|uniref:J domain-containing protein n=1 Tax=Mixia osmundae (strain CBS 9802 / IAM 14324 / JCM 22182 / KY 12970) TaxID=764103 RepID=G7EAW1_MIXOS|nr:uncharacterized protein L969DRAFT_19559 [Mixia osmundae IAM 14324]KEI37005.1 hypothetical protein L969DRAFT_19559 [Mixia osmundae IAM 14324]GAA99971.1 hypothetical protein E5Q_06674 [Mixia osmundae IAM 14324]